MTTVQEIIDSARIRHWSFTDLALGDGAVLLFLNERQRTHLAALGPGIEGLIGTSLQYTLSLLSGQKLVALLNGVPTYNTTFQDGYATHLTALGTPYIDTSEAAIAGDPFGQNGGTPGFPLPADFVRLISVGAVYGAGTVGRNIPVDVIPEHSRFSTAPGRNPTAFVSGNRLVPMFPNAAAGANTNDRWYSISALQISYVAMTTLAALSDTLQLPRVLCEALTADIASMLADQSPKCTPADRVSFARKASEAAGRVGAASNDILESVQESRVLHKG